MSILEQAFQTEIYTYIAWLTIVTFLQLENGRRMTRPSFFVLRFPLSCLGPENFPTLAHAHGGLHELVLPGPGKLIEARKLACLMALVGIICV